MVVKRVIMDNTDEITHSELIKLGRNWLIKPYSAARDYGRTGCSVVITELVTSIMEQPDVLGFTSTQSILIECKASRADYNADKNKPFRQCPEIGVGIQRWYLAPQGIIPSDSLPPKWGLLEVTAARRIKVVKRAEPQGRSAEYEITLLISLLRRLNIQPCGNVAVQRYTIGSEKNKATFYIQGGKYNEFDRLGNKTEWPGVQKRNPTGGRKTNGRRRHHRRLWSF